MENANGLKNNSIEIPHYSEFDRVWWTPTESTPFINFVTWTEYLQKGPYAPLRNFKNRQALS